jgi:hypothetical protein
MSQENVAELSHPRRARVLHNEYPPLDTGTGAGSPRVEHAPAHGGKDDMTRRWTKLGAALVASVCSVALFGAPGAVAKETQCTGGSANPLSGTHDNVVVPPGASCFVDGAVVNGTLKALEDSTLTADPLLGGDSSTFGNVVGDKAEVVRFLDNTVLGNFEFREGESVELNRDVAVADNIVGGNLKIEKMTGAMDVVGNTVGGKIQVVENLIQGGFNTLFVQENEVAGHLQVFENLGPGDKSVNFNAVDKNLQCFDNAPPFTGQPNTVFGKAQGQCAQP